jgi:glycosyltransferase involved in cell wall biosynthesis
LKNSLVSVITVVLNDVNSILKTLDSVKYQKYEHIEYLVIDGGSTDGTLELLKKYGDNFKLISGKDSGIYDAMNKGINLSTGDWIMFMNSGDLFANDNVVSDLINNYKLNKGFDFIYGDTILYGHNYSYQYKKSYNFSYITLGMPFCHQSVLVNSVLLKGFNFDLSYKIASDFDFFLSLYLRGNLKYIKAEIPISIFDTQGVSMSVRTFEEMLTVIKKSVRILGAHIYLFHFFRLQKFYFSRYIKSFFNKVI